MDQKKLDKILGKHKKWLAGEPDGERAVLRGCDMRGCNMSGCDLRHSDLRDSDLRHSDLSGCDLSGCNLSGCKGMVSPIRYMEENFDRSVDGYIAYKTFNTIYIAPSRWILQPGAVIEETVNANRMDECGCGINVAPFDWVKKHYVGEVWKVLIRWEWLPGVCVPYNTDGKIRCERVELIEIVH